MATCLDPDEKPRSIEIESIPSRHGLTSVQAAELLREFGPNLLPASPPPSLWKLVAAQMVHFFALMLWVAGAMAILAGMPQLGVATAPTNHLPDR
jgi:cation transport ATPase-like protein